MYRSILFLQSVATDINPLVQTQSVSHQIRQFKSLEYNHFLVKWSIVIAAL